MLRKIALASVLAAVLAMPVIADEPQAKPDAAPPAAAAAEEPGNDAVCGLSADNASTLITLVEELKLAETPAPEGYKSWQDNQNRINWTVTTPGHPAHPSAICRKVVQDQLRADVKMELRCDGPQAACDDLVGLFQTLTDQMRRNVQIRY
jgi:hypothetical protein